MTTCEEAKQMRSGINIQGRVNDKDEVRIVKTKYGETKVCDAYLADDSGRIKLTLWGADTEKVKDGDCISIEGGYTTFWNGVQLNKPIKGKLEIISCDDKKKKPARKWSMSDYTAEDIEEIEKQVSKQGQPYYHGSTKY